MILWGDKKQKLRELENRDRRMEVYLRLLRNVLDRPIDAVSFWIGYAERLLRFEVLDGRAGEDEVEGLIDLLRKAAAVRTKTSLKNDDFILPSPEARGLIHYIRTERRGMKLYDGYIRDDVGVCQVQYSEQLHALMPVSLTGDKPPRLLVAAGRRGYDDQRMIEVILWADALGGLDEVSRFLKKEGKWCYA